MRQNHQLIAAALVAVVASVGAIESARATTVFSDNLTASQSTVNGTSTPTGGTTTSYDIASGKNSSADVITAAGLGLTLPISSSAIVEAQGIFTNAPITLTNVGDYIELTTTFNIAAGSPFATYFGLYNSGGSKPATDLANGGLSSSLTNDATGGAQNYIGYVANIQNNTGTSSKIQIRPAQASGTNTSQDLVSAGASGSQSYTGQITLGSTNAAAAAPMSSGNTYTEDFLITVTAAAAGTTPIQYSLDSNLYSGSSATGTAISTIHGTDPVTNSNGTFTYGYNNFDAFALGFAEKNSTTPAPEIDYSSLTIASNVVQQQLLDGDANGDGKVDLNDLNTVLNHLGVASTNRSDGNFDGAPTIDLNDLNDVLNHLGTSLSGSVAQQVQEAQQAYATSAVPEPSSLALLAVGGAFLLKGRRKSKR